MDLHFSSVALSARVQRRFYICREGFSFVIQCSYFTDKITFLGRYFILQYCFISVLHNSILNCICGDVPETVCPLVLVAHIAASFLFRIHWEIHFHLIKKESLLFLVFLLTILFCSIKASICFWSIWLGTFSIDNAEIR